MHSTPKPPKTDKDAHAPGISKTLEEGAARAREHQESLHDKEDVREEEEGALVEERRRI